MYKLFRKTLALTMVGAGLLTTGFVTSAFAADVPAGTKLATKQVLALQIGDNPATLDPNLTSENVGSQIINNLFEGLTSYDAKGNLVPGVAESWSHTPDNKTWIFKLRKDAKWSDGSPVTAKDFVASWQRLVDPKTASEYSFYLGDLGVKNAKAIADGKAPVSSLGVKAVDDYTLEVSLESAVPWFLEATSLADLAPIPSKLLAAGKWPNFSNLVSNGPYKLVQAIPNEKYTITKNPNYWDAKKTVITDVTFVVARSSNDAYKRFLAGDLDAFAIESPVLKERLSKGKNDGFTVLSAPGSSMGFYTFNVAKAPFNNEDVRRALLLAVDTKELQTKVFRNTLKATSVWASPAIKGVEKIKQSAYFNQPMPERIAQAKKLLTKAGYSESKPLTFTINYNTSDGNKQMAIALQAQFKTHLGKLVNVDLHNVEWSTFLSERKTGAYSFYRMGWGADYYEPSTFYSIWTSTNPTNTGGYKSAEYDKLFDSLATTKTFDERIALYQKMNDLLNKNVVGIPLTTPVLMTAVKDGVRGYNVDDNVRRVFNMYIVAK
ncbi:peptide ABC transporter substrate-binding protein [Psittacicella hinzii]|uniref:Solute-binding protein family 5 domain-containing protein n=1 Tax=Psittacicella hinzii TaxID=2028575 RepID=A0A3A1Y9A1_9GAMM|nr:peptide ABC transporter substrate-binding protein [Psittacicella hinzii]RIY34762.1 hypothetical protein CKF58_07710 [Psittacicella hinzii]